VLTYSLKLKLTQIDVDINTIINNNQNDRYIVIKFCINHFHFRSHINNITDAFFKNNYYILIFILNFRNFNML